MPDDTFDGVDQRNTLASRRHIRLNPDPRRVISKLFVPGEETAGSRSRARAVITRILDLDESEVAELADSVLNDFRGRHRDLAATFARHFEVVAHEIAELPQLSAQRRMLIGACFTHEYSPEAAALFNPSMAAHPDQSGLSAGQLRFLMTVRCVGEGHLSSIGLRTGVIGPDNALVVDKPDPLLIAGASRPAAYQLSLIKSRLADLGDDDETVELLLAGLPDTFTHDQLVEALAEVHTHTLNRQRVGRTVDHIHQVAAATYDLEFPADSSLTERLLWPTAPMETHGMEDARLVRSVDDDASVTYYATYTAYDGARVAPHLFATKDFQRFHVSPMAGPAAQNKGLALFPRRIGGRYFALSRWDRESISLAESDDLRIWHESARLHLPRRGWELIQVGNCGSPIETPDGWLVLTHGVGPMRVYGVGAMLLDLAHPSKVLASLPNPLLTPAAEERDGYVPNVVYSCGPLLYGDTLTIPYGISDGAIGFAQVHLPDLIRQMR
jgi:predicted GH43/DUF377 family glycosyl hydrolase